MLQLPLYELSGITSLTGSSLSTQLSAPSWPWGTACPAGGDPQQPQFHGSMRQSLQHPLPHRFVPALPAVLCHSWQTSVRPCPKVNICLGTFAALTDLACGRGLPCERHGKLQPDQQTVPLSPAGRMLFLRQPPSAHLLPRLCAAACTPLPPVVTVASPHLSRGCCNLFVMCPQKINFKEDWKLITVLVGGNDLCQYCLDKVCVSESGSSRRLARDQPWHFNLPLSQQGKGPPCLKSTWKSHSFHLYHSRSKCTAFSTGVLQLGSNASFQTRPPARYRTNTEDSPESSPGFTGQSYRDSAVPQARCCGDTSDVLFWKVSPHSNY